MRGFVGMIGPPGLQVGVWAWGNGFWFPHTLCPIPAPLFCRGCQALLETRGRSET